MLSRDPLGGGLKAPTSQNRYAYALDNPTTYSDPSGLSPVLAASQAGSSYTLSGTLIQAGQAMQSFPLADPLLDLGLLVLGVLPGIGPISVLLGIVGLAIAAAGKIVEGVGRAIQGQPFVVGVIAVAFIALLALLLAVALAASLVMLAFTTPEFSLAMLVSGGWLVALAFMIVFLAIYGVLSYALMSCATDTRCSKSTA